MRTVGWLMARTDTNATNDRIKQFAAGTKAKTMYGFSIQTSNTNAEEWDNRR